MPDFSYQTNFLLQIPEDTAFLQYGNMQSLLVSVTRLVEAGHVFVVSPAHNQIAMSQQAARDIGVLL